jgi:hypothetical protein
MGSKRCGWIVGLAVAGAMACATNRPPNAYALADGTTAPVVTVRNDNWLDVAVYLVRGDAKFRIGTVTGSSTQTFSLAREGVNSSTPFRILADPIGENRQYVTDPVVISPGQRLEVKVGSPLSISSFALWNR